MPALLKPAPRSLAAQLWMLKHGGPEAKGLDELQRLASSGRTSIPVDKDVAEAALPHHRLSCLRRARHSRRHSGAPRRSDPPRAGLARGFVRHKTRRRVQRFRIYRHRRDDVADRRVRRGLCFDPALARLSHGETAETGGAGTGCSAAAGRAGRKLRGAIGRCRPASRDTGNRGDGNRGRRTRADLAPDVEPERPPEEIAASQPPAATCRGAIRRRGSIQRSSFKRAAPSEAAPSRSTSEAAQRSSTQRSSTQRSSTKPQWHSRGSGGPSLRRASDDRSVAAPAARRASAIRAKASGVAAAATSGRPQSLKAKPLEKRLRPAPRTDRPSRRPGPRASARNAPVRASVATIAANGGTARRRVSKRRSLKQRMARSSGRLGKNGQIVRTGKVAPNVAIVPSGRKVRRPSTAAGP